MARVLSVAAERFPIAGTFTISRGSKTEAEVIACAVSQDGRTGRGECVPYRRYGETMESVAAAIESVRGAIEDGCGRDALLGLLPAGAARNALDCALWDLEAKAFGHEASQAGSAGPRRPRSSPPTRCRSARRRRWRRRRAPMPAGRCSRSRSAAKATSSASGRWSRQRPAAASSSMPMKAGRTPTSAENLAAAAELGVALIEQPLPAGRDAILRSIAHPVPICADESVHTAADLPGLKGLYDAVNIKLDKAGGLTAALELRDAARAAGFSIMVGCMVGTSLAMAPAVLLAQGAEFTDLDGPLLLARDRSPALAYRGSLVSPPEPALWG